MSSTVLPHEPVLSRWQGQARALEVRERWRVFCDAQARRLNSPDPVADPRSVPPVVTAVTTASTQSPRMAFPPPASGPGLNLPWPSGSATGGHPPPPPMTWRMH